MIMLHYVRRSPRMPFFMYKKGGLFERGFLDLLHQYEDYDGYYQKVDEYTYEVLYREHNGSQRKSCISPFASCMKNVMMGIRLSATRAKTRLPAAPPMMTAMACVCTLERLEYRNF